MSRSAGLDAWGMLEQAADPLMVYNVAKLEEITVQKLKPEGEDATSELMRYHA